MPLDCWERSSAADSEDTYLHDLLSMPGSATFACSQGNGNNKLARSWNYEHEGLGTHLSLRQPPLQTQDLERAYSTSLCGKSPSRSPDGKGNFSTATLETN